MIDHILMKGLNHATAPIQVREQVACKRDELEKVLPELISPESGSPLTEVVILSTCNRTEIYSTTSDLVRSEGFLGEFFESRQAWLSAPMGECLYSYRGREAAQHLLRVACGLDSMILGEFEILGQVRSAYEIAGQYRSVGPILTSLFHSAIHTGKRARSETAIGRGAASVAYAAVDLARRQIGDLKNACVLVIGSGEMGQRAVKNLAADGVKSLYVANRSYDHAVEAANGLGGQAIPFAELPSALSQADLVISATGAPHIVLNAGMIAGVMATRPQRPLCLIDIAVPRDVDQAAAQIPNVRLVDLDGLNQVTEENIAVREKEVAKVQAIVANETNEFWSWYQARRAVPVIAALRERAETIRVAELEKAMRRLGHLNLNERDRNVIAALSSGLVSKLLAAPTERLKERAENGDGRVYLETLKRLFELPDDDTDVPPIL